jgi:hypothetical protein
MRVVSILCISLFALVGCAAKVTSSGERTVMVNAGSVDGAGALSVANEECKKHGRYARLLTKPTGDRQWVFDCVN